jgi:MFS family permease
VFALPRDGWLLLTGVALRSAAYGWLSVILGLYLATLGLEPAAIGVVFTAALAGGALLTLGITAVTDRLGRRRVLAGGALLMVVAALAFAAGAPGWLLALVAVGGTLTPSGKDIGPLLPIEQAVLPQITPDVRRTAIFALYNLISSVAGAVGALLVSVPPAAGLDELTGYRVLLLACAAVGLILLALYNGLSPAVEAPRPVGARRGQPFTAARGEVMRLAGLFALDAFAGGFVVQAIVAWWLHLRYALGPGTLGAIFFGTNLLAALSFLLAPPLAQRFGLLNTMVFTHLPSNVLLMLVPLMPTAEGAIAALWARHLLSQLDVPTRQSYSMAIVPAAERTAAAGVLAVARNAGTAVAPPLATLALSAPGWGLPFLIAGSLKIVYDLAILYLFRQVRPPEEQRTPPLGLAR